MPLVNPNELIGEEPKTNDDGTIAFTEQYILIGLLVFLPFAILGGMIIQTDWEFFEVRAGTLLFSSPFLLIAILGLKDALTFHRFTFDPKEKKVSVTGFNPLRGRIRKEIEYKNIEVVIKKRILIEKPIRIKRCVYLNFGFRSVVFIRSESENAAVKDKSRLAITLNIPMKNQQQNRFNQALQTTSASARRLS